MVTGARSIARTHHTHAFQWLLLLGWFATNSAWAQQHHYVSTTDGQPHDVMVTVQQGAVTTIVLEEYKRYSKHLLHPTRGTQRWELRDDKLGHNFIAKRDGRIIHIKGTFQQEPIDKQIEVGDALWYNKLDHGLSDFAASDRQKQAFFALKLLSDLDPIDMEAEKVGTERVVVGGKSLEAVKVKLTLNHFLLSKMWSAHCWFRPSDGLFLRYQGANGRPGTPETVIEWHGRAEPR